MQLKTSSAAKPRHFVDIADAHHMVAGDANDAFNTAVFDYIEKLAKSRV